MRSPNPKTGYRARGVALALVAAVLWGVSGTCAQFLFQYRGVSAEWLVTVRLLGAGVVLLACSRDFWTIWRRDGWSLLAFSLCGVAAVQYTYFAAIRASNAATATVLQYTGPALIVLWYALRHRVWPRPVDYAALAFATLGTFLLVTHGSFHSLSISGWALFWGLASAVTMVFYTVQPVRMLHTYPSSLIIGWAMVVGGVCFCCIAPPWKVPGHWDGAGVGCLAAIVLLGTLIAFYSYLTAVRRIGATTASLLSCAEPVVAATLTVAWLHVPFGWMDWLGTGCVLGTILLLTLRPSRS